jgi:UTP:GlnB (protein PII) uridylyltransferase
VLAAHRVHIDSASITSYLVAHGPVAVQVFFVRDEFQQLIANDDRRWARIERDLRAVFSAENRFAAVEALLEKRDEGYSVKPTITTRDDTQVKIFDGESSDYSVVEVHTTDAVGLLHCISKVLAEQGLDIHRAMVSTEGDRIADVFYVQKLVDGAKLNAEESAELERAVQRAVGKLS